MKTSFETISYLDITDLDKTEQEIISEYMKNLNTTFIIVTLEFSDEKMPILHSQMTHQNINEVIILT